MPAGEVTADDLRSWGVLYHYMMQHCALLSQRKLEQAMEHSGVTEQVYSSAAQQKIALFCDIGKGSDEAARYHIALETDKSNPMLWLLCTAAHEFIGEYETALEVVLQGVARFPDKPALYIHAGDICRCLKRYDEAFTHWQKAIALDHTYLHALYSMGFCYEELGQYSEAHRVWTELIKELDSRGLIIERTFPAKQAEACLIRIPQEKQPRE